MRYGLVDTEWGVFGFVARGRRLVATFLPQPRPAVERSIRSQFPAAEKKRDLLPRFCSEVAAYFDGKDRDFSVELDLSDVTPFRQTVLAACRRIPYGKTASYGDLARAAGVPKAARAVGSAMANNPVPLVIPCHRVLCSDGSLGGFSSPNGVKQKVKLLQLEQPLYQPPEQVAVRARQSDRTRNRKRKAVYI